MLRGNGKVLSLDVASHTGGRHLFEACAIPDVIDLAG